MQVDGLTDVFCVLCSLGKSCLLYAFIDLNMIAVIMNLFIIIHMLRMVPLIVTNVRCVQCVMVALSAIGMLVAISVMFALLGICVRCLLFAS